MPCGRCGTTKTAKQVHVWTSADGKETKSFSSQTEANAKKARSGGTVTTK